ncbi:centromere protein T [Protopterus annectens]|uniref:centromere protein T n=1 Tax=Protopterus annectens TaxID=7888 RepID=UPI001CFC045D|nr:centromere protein T [Protopterus annectens]
MSRRSLDLMSPAMNIRSKMKENIRCSAGQAEFITPGPLNAPKKKSASKTYKPKKVFPVVLPKTSKDEFENETPRTLLRNIIRTEPESSLLIPERPVALVEGEAQPESGSETSSTSTVSLDRVLPDIVSEDNSLMPSNVGKLGRKRKKKKKKIHISQFLSPDERNSLSNVAPGPADNSAGNSFGGISLSVPDPEKSILKPGLQRRPKKRKVISVEDFEQAVNQDLQNFHSQDKCATESQVAFSDKSATGMGTFPLDIMLSNTELFIQPSTQLLSPSSSVSVMKNSSLISDTRRAADSGLKPTNMRSVISTHDLISSSDPVLGIPKVTSDVHQSEDSVSALYHSRNIGGVTGHITGIDSAPVNQADTDEFRSPTKASVLSPGYFKRSKVQGPSGHSQSIIGSPAKIAEVQSPGSDTASSARRSRRVAGIQGPEIQSPLSKTVSGVSDRVFDVVESERGSDKILGNSGSTAEVQDLAVESALSRRIAKIQDTPGKFSLVRGSPVNIAEIRSPVIRTAVVPEHSRHSIGVGSPSGSSSLIPGSPRSKTYRHTGEIVAEQRYSTTLDNVTEPNDGFDLVAGGPRNITDIQSSTSKSFSRLSENSANAPESEYPADSVPGRPQLRKIADVQESETQGPLSKTMSRSSDNAFNVQEPESGSNSVTGNSRDITAMPTQETGSVLRSSRRPADAQQHFGGSDSLPGSPRNVAKIKGPGNEPTSLPRTSQRTGDSTSVPGSPDSIAEVHGPVNDDTVLRVSRRYSYKQPCDESDLVPKSSPKSTDIQSPMRKTLSPGHSRKTASLPISFGNSTSLSRSRRNQTEVQSFNNNTVSTPRSHRIVADVHSPLCGTKIAPRNTSNVIDTQSPSATLRQKLSVKILNLFEEIDHDSVMASPISSTGVQKAGTGVISKHLASHGPSHNLELASESSRSRLRISSPSSKTLQTPQHSNRSTTPQNSVHGSSPVLRSSRLNVEVYSPVKKVSSPRHSTTGSDLRGLSNSSRVESSSLRLIPAPVPDEAQGENLELEPEHEESRNAAFSITTGKGSGNVLEVVSRHSAGTSTLTGNMPRIEELENSVFLASEGRGGALSIHSSSDPVSESVNRTHVAHSADGTEDDQEFFAKRKSSQFDKLLDVLASESGVSTEKVPLTSGPDKKAASVAYDGPLSSPSSSGSQSESINKTLGGYAAERVVYAHKFRTTGEPEDDERHEIVEDEVIIPANKEPSEEPEEEQDTSDVTEAESDDCSSNRPAFLQIRQASSSPILARSHFLKTTPSIIQKQVPVPKKEPHKRVQKSAEKVPRLPRSLIKSIFAHYAKVKVSKDGYAAVDRCVELYLQQVCKDLDIFANHAKRKTVEKEDVELLLKRQGHVSDKVPLNVLIERHLPLEYRSLLIPAAVSGNEIIPKK